jgi:hypothetical protein
VQPMHAASSIRTTARGPAGGGSLARNVSIPSFYRRRRARWFAGDVPAG